MRTMRTIFIICMLMMFAVPGYVSAETTVDVNGVNVTVAYKEPVTNKTGTDLTDLHHTSIYHNAEGEFTAVIVPASAPTGGGEIAHDVIVPIAEDQEADVSFKTTASDISGNESVDSNVVIKRIDRLAPAGTQ